MLAFPSADTGSAASFYNSSALESGSSVKASQGVLYGISGYNSGSAQFLHVFNSATQPNNGDAPITVVKIAADNNFS